jgi:aminopeptidase N
MKRWLLIFPTILLLAPLPVLALEPVHHDLRVVVEPERRRFRAIDTVSLPAGHPRQVDFLLHRKLNPVTPTPGVRLQAAGSAPGRPHLEAFRALLPAGVDAFVLEYAGVIDHPPELYGEEHARGMRVSAGTIGAEGVYLAGGSGWYPQTPGLLAFRLRVELPAGWEGVSQGTRSEHRHNAKGTVAVWEVAQPQEEIYLVAAPFVEYARPAGRAEAMVFLRQPDEQLAGRYLEATARYLAMYEKLLGPYPYGKFALVENFWETGYGMPSFTLLGPKVLRLPFILTTSYPHEILHNWWGNGVFPDYGRGNWAEGLTAYLADHLLKEQQGQGAEYRQTTLQKYADYVRGGKDFPLIEFRSRHSAATEAIGYGKALMFFHMLRQRLGDETFIRGLRDFYGRFLFRSADYGDLRQSFERVAGQDLKSFFGQWVERSGAPELVVDGTKVQKEGDGFVLTLNLEQKQKDSPYRLRVPLAVTLEGRAEAYETTVEMTSRRQKFRLPLPARPLRLDVDPQFDLFRRLHREEIPPALSQVLGADNLLVLLPANAAGELTAGYRELAWALTRSGAGASEVRFDTEVERLPADRAVALLGWENLFRAEVSAALSGHDVALDAAGVRLGLTKLPRAGHSVVLTARHPRSPAHALAWIAADPAGALPGLSRKLPHYHKYSYLGFTGEEPANVAKGRWPVLASPLTVFLPDTDGKPATAAMGKLALQPPLTELPLVFPEAGVPAVQLEAR